MERIAPPTPKYNIGDRVTVLIDEDRGAFEIDEITSVLVMASRAHGWRVGYYCKKNKDISYESKHIGELVTAGGRKFHQLPEPKFWIDALVKYKYGFRDWTAGVIDEITMEYRTLRWEFEYWFRGMDEPVKEGMIGSVIEQRFEPPRSAAENGQQAPIGEPAGDL